MTYVIMDLEWNAAYSRKIGGFINEIIEFGAVKCDENLNIISTFSSLVRIQVGKRLNAVVSSLTSIDEKSLSSAMSFMQVVSRFKKWAGTSVILTWGTSDILTLIENFKYFNGSPIIPFLTYYVDLQRYCESLLKNDGKEQLGLVNAAKMLSVDVSQIDQHRALDDSLLALAIFKRLWPQNSLDSFIEDGRNPEFYRKMTFKTSIISDITHPLVTKKSLIFACDKCGKETVRMSKWEFRNKRFVADFKCGGCGYAFSGRIQLKEKYEGLVVNKKSVSLPKIEEPRKVLESCVIGNMNLKLIGGVGLLEFRHWEGYGGISHCFSSRIGGVSQGKFASMNLGFNRGDRDANVLENIDIICSAMGVDKSLLVAGNQDHNVNIKAVGKEHGGTGFYSSKFEESIDGLCTDEKGVTLVVYAADCVPIYYYDPVRGVIGLAHAGWRGTAAAMAGEMVKKLRDEYGCKPHDIRVAIGPSIGKECFEVDPPCADEFKKLKDSHLFVTDTGKGKFLVDLWECNRRFLLEEGVPQENITVGEVCSMCNSDLIYSHRVTQGQRGSNAAMLTLI